MEFKFIICKWLFSAMDINLHSEFGSVKYIHKCNELMALENGFSIISIIMNMNLKLKHPESWERSKRVKIMVKRSEERTKANPPTVTLS